MNKLSISFLSFLFLAFFASHSYSQLIINGGLLVPTGTLRDKAAGDGYSLGLKLQGTFSQSVAFRFGGGYDVFGTKKITRYGYKYETSGAFIPFSYDLLLRPGAYLYTGCGASFFIAKKDFDHSKWGLTPQIGIMFGRIDVGGTFNIVLDDKRLTYIKLSLGYVLAR